MKKRFLTLLFIPFLLGSCNKAEPEAYNGETHSVEHARKTGDIGGFNLTSPQNGFTTNHGFTFTWEEASNSDYYQLEMASTPSFISDDEDEVYVR